MLLSMGVAAALLAVAAPVRAAQRDAGDAALAGQIRNDPSLRQVHQMALDLLKGGFNAGAGYKAVWIRDMNTFIQLALEVNPPARVRAALLTFFKFQGADGDIVDLYFPVPSDPGRIRPSYRTSLLAPGLMADKNTVEVDQESSLVQAIYKYVQATGDRSILDETIDGKMVRDRLAMALNYLLTDHYDARHGLIWGATRLDWGDVQPESPHGTVLDEHSHRALCIYDNAMLMLALNDYIQLIGKDSIQARHWIQVRDRLRKNIRKVLWDEKNQKYIPHVYLAGSPFPRDFDENAIYYHGGTAVAIEAGLLSHKEVAGALAHMDADVKNANAATIGLTMYPAYPEGFFQNPQVRKPYSYQNGGDWTWFGGRMVQDLVADGDYADAYRELRPMVDRVIRVHDFYEWWTPQDEPRGSSNFRGSAGVLGRAIEMLEDWANRQK